MPETTADAEDNANRDRYVKAFSFMTTLTIIVGAVIAVSCMLFKAAKAAVETAATATAAATSTGMVAPFYLRAVYAIIGTGKENGWVAMLLCLVLFGWFITTSLYLLTTRPMLDLFQSTPILEKIKLYAVYPILFLIGLVLILGVVMFMPWFSLNSFRDSNYKRTENEYGPDRDADTESFVYKIAQRLGLGEAYKTLTENFFNLVRFASFVGLGGIMVAAITLVVAVSVFVATNQTVGVLGLLKVILVVVAVLIAVAAVISGYDAVSQKDRSYALSKTTSIPVFILKVLKYIPCFILDVVDAVKREFNLTTKPVWILMGVECVIIGLYFLAPMAVKAVVFKDSATVLPGVADLRKSKDLGTLEHAGIVRTSECSHKTKRKYDYSFSAWLFLNPHPPNVAKGGNEFIPILDINGIPTLRYKSSTNELQITLKIKENGSTDAHGDDGADGADGGTNSVVTTTATPGSAGSEPTEIETARTPPPITERSVVVYTIQNIPLQRWNHFFYNYDGANIDIFLNDELVVSITDRVPAIEHGVIKIGAPNGVIGNIANVVFFNHHTTKDVISGIYMSRKDSSPPI
jgi:hypothetical protein